jgi:DNA polymerase type B, organellar and viral
MNNSNRFFHWTPSFNTKMDSINSGIQLHQATKPENNPDNKNLNFNINNSPSNKASNFYSNFINSQSLTKITAKGSKRIQNISTVFKKVTISFLELTKIKFLNLLLLNLQLRSINSILFQYTSYPSGIYYMLGKQVGVVVHESHDLTHYRNLFEHYKETLELLMDRYQLETPDFITFHFKTLHVDEDLLALKKTLSNIELHKGLVKVEKLKQNFNSKVLPYTYNERYLGNLVIGNLRQKYLSELVSFISKNNYSETTRTEKSITIPIEFSNNEKELKYSFESGLEFLQHVLNSPTAEYKVFVHGTRKYLIISRQITNYIINRYVFNLKTGHFLFWSRDLLKLDESFKYLYNVNDEKLWVRKTGGTSLVFNENSNIQALVTHIPLKAIKYVDFKKNINLEKQNKTPPQPVSNPNYGVLDLETFTDKNYNGERYSRVFALGFITKLDRTPKIYYLTDYFDNTTTSSNKLVLKCIDEMLNYANSNYIYYVHNLGKFDIIFLQKILLDYNLNVKDKYVLTPLYRDNKILRLIIKSKENRSIKIYLVDSMNLLNDKLSKLSKDYDVNTTKGYFPYSFVNKHNLNYEGLTPHISYYNSNLDTDWYYSTLSLNWNLKSETLNYLAKDLSSLLEVLIKFQDHLFLDHNLEMTDCLTISSLAKNKFLKHYLNDSKIPLINSNTLFNFIYSSYFGGNTEVYKPFGINLIYLDVNSLYPYNAMNPMPGIDCNWVESFDKNGLNLDQLFGVFHAEVITSDLYIGLLPVKTNTGIIYPNGKFSGIWTSIELQFARKYGYKIKVTKGYQFSTSENVFKFYVEELSKLKNKLTGSQRQVIKSLLNNLLGRFALDYVKPITKTVNKKVLDNILATRVVKTLKEMNSDSFVLTYMPLLDKEVCESHNIDYYKAILNERSHNIEKFVNVFQDTSIIISAFTNAYARVHMNKIKLDILAAGSSLFYSDTDSIVTDLSLDKLKELMPGKVGTELGQLKFEYIIRKGYFISNKVYALLLNDGTIIKKGKGFSTDSISFSDYEQMYHYSQSIKANKIYGKTNYSLGSVLIENKKIIIDWNSYKKRDKIYNSKTNIWIDTRPLLFDNLTRSLAVYIPKYIIKYAKPLLFENITRSLVVFVPKNIIIFSPTSGQDHKNKLVCSAHGCENKNNNAKNINNTASFTDCSVVQPLNNPHKGGWLKRCLHWFTGRFNATVRIIRNNYIQQRGEELSNIQNINYIIIFLLLLLVLCIYFPSLFYYFSGLDLYNTTNSIYYMSLFEIRKACAIIFWHALFYLVIFIQYRFNLHIPIFNKPIILASTPIIIKGGFEGLGDPELDEQNTKPRLTFLERIKNESLITDSDLGVHSKYSSNTFPKFKPEVTAVSEPYPPESSNAIHAKPSTESSSSSGLQPLPITRTTTELNTPIISESNSELMPAKEVNNNKKVRINAIAEVKEISESGLVQKKPELLKRGLEGEDKLNRPEADERIENNNNQIKNTFVWDAFLNWQNKYPRVVERIRPAISLIYGKGCNDKVKNKSSLPVSEPTLSNVQGHLINNSTTTAKLESRKYLKDVKLKFKIK